MRAGWRAPVLALLLAGAVLLPVMHTPLRFDDRGALALREQIRLSGSSLGDQVWSEVRKVVRDQRRLQPLGVIEANLVRWALPERAAYKALLIAMTLAALALLYALVRRLGLPPWGGALVVAASAGAFQFRAYHDALLGYYGTVQLLLVLLLASLLALHRHLTGGGRGWLAAAVGLFALSLTTYEVAPPLAVVPVALIAGTIGVNRRAVLLAAPFLALAAVWTFSVWWARQTGKVAAGYGTELDPLAAVRTWFWHVVAAVPGSYMAFDPHGIRPDPTAAELLAAAWRTVAFAALAGWALWRHAPAWRLERRTLPTLAMVGAALWLAAPLLVAAAPKYQQEITAGLGYLPVLIQYLGWGLVAAVAAIAAVRLGARRGTWAGRGAAVGATALLSLLAAITFYGNQRVVALEAPTTAERELMRDALAHGVLFDLPEGSGLLLHMRDMAWPREGFVGGDPALDAEVSAVSGRLYDTRIAPPPDSFTCPSSPDILARPDCATLGDAQWLMVRPRIGAGTAIAVRLRDATRGRALTATAEALRVYTHDLDGPPRLVGFGTVRPWSSDRLRWSRVAGGDDWAIYEAPVAARDAPVGVSVDDPAGRIDFRVAEAPGLAVRRLGTRWLLP